ncbi:MAG: hypothetical protein RJB62_999 [Pseudomonadota bacterium]|jgi:hypothetical protein
MQGTHASAEVHVVLLAPETYRDAGLYRPLGESAREPTLRAVREHMIELGERYLPPQQTLTVEVLDIDLAGEFEWWHTQYDVRFLRNVTSPRMQARYVLEENGRVIDQAEEWISDSGYLLMASPARSGVLPSRKE